MRRERRDLYLALIAPLLLLICLACAASPSSELEAEASIDFDFTDVRSQTLEFLAYEESITLTADQERIKRQALLDLPAPCCSDRSAYTCCCECNLGRSWWGLAKHLIVHEGYDAAQVRTAVQEWHRFVNPKGFSGDSCYTGGCNRSFENNGCGGMTKSHLAF